MILSDREIRILVERGRIGISPMPADDAWSATSIDFTLAPQIRRWKVIPAQPGLGMHTARFSPGVEGYDINELIQEHTTEVICTDEKPFELKPTEFALGWTVEKVRFPIDSRVAARVEGKSSLARIGLGIHVTAPTIHGGFGGGKKDGDGLQIQLEMWNTGPLSILLRPGLKICQLIFEEVHGTPEKAYAGQFTAQGPGPR